MGNGKRRFRGHIPDNDRFLLLSCGYGHSNFAQPSFFGRFFDKLADGDVSPPRGAASQIFNLGRDSFAFGEIAKSAEF